MISRSVRTADARDHYRNTGGHSYGDQNEKDLISMKLCINSFDDSRRIEETAALVAEHLGLVRSGILSV